MSLESMRKMMMDALEPEIVNVNWQEDPDALYEEILSTIASASMAIEDMRQGMLRQWIETGDTDEGREIREVVWKNSKLLGIFVNVLKGYIERAGTSNKVERP